MKIGFRKPNLKRMVTHRTTVRMKKAVKNEIFSPYMDKGMGVLHPKKAIYNKVYHKVTFGISNLFK